MARIPEGEIERIKQEISVERLAASRGIRLERHGADLIGLCPFHEDREPSLVITPAKNLWHCLGTCSTGGSVIDWVMRANGVSFRHAVELLRANHASLAAPGKIVRKATTAAVKLDLPFETSADDQFVLRQAVDYYHETLKESPEALKYLQGRGLDHPNMIAHFRLGFSNRSLGYRLPQANRKAGAEIRGRLQRLGILRESGHEHFNGSVVFPVIDLEGNVTEIYGRKITEGLRPGTPLHMYLPGPHKGVWNEEALVVSKEIILCESLIDALSFWCADYRNVTGSYGVNGFTEDHRQALRKHGTRKVLIAYDRDEAGEQAAAALADELLYELVFERIGNDDQPVFPGLIDVEKLRIHGYEEKYAGLERRFAGSKPPQNGRIAGGARVSHMPVDTGADADFGQNPENSIDTGERDAGVVIVASGGR